MTKLKLLCLAAMLGGGAAAAAPPPTPPVFWAGCAGALAVKAQRGDKAASPRAAQMARRALAQAKLAANPEKLTETQINGVAISAGRSFTAALRQDPGRAAAFEKAVGVCTEALAKLPG